MLRKINSFFFDFSEPLCSTKRVSTNLLGKKIVFFQLLLKLNKNQDVTAAKTIYVGNLPFNIREEILWEFFTKLGEVKRIITGINRIDLSQCGVCFVEFYHSKTTVMCLKKNGLKLKNRFLRIDLDEGFYEGRQFGRGKKGGQLLEEIGFSKKKQKFLKKGGRQF